MQMMRCPACGAANSVKRAACFQCEAELHSVGTPVITSEVRVCKNCAHATVSPPVGTTVRGSEVWCLKLSAGRDANHPGPACFQGSFTWRREESLD